jgi:Tfp pilus assembly protein PilP
MKITSLAIMLLLATKTYAQTPSGVDSPVDLILTEDLIASLRDPFQMPAIVQAKKEAPKTDLEMFELKEFKLNGVITGPKKTKAMLTATNGRTYFVSIGDRIGSRGGRITAIQSDSIKVVEYEVDEKGRRTPDVFQINISGEVESLSKKEEL